MGRIVCYHAERAPVDAGERSKHPRPEAMAQLEHGALVKQRVHDAAHIVDASALLRNQLPQQILIGHGSGIARSPEVGQVALCIGHGRLVVAGAQVDDAVCVLHVDRPDLAGLVYPEPAALDHCGPAHPDARVLGGDDHVAAAQQRRVAREAVARHDPHQRYQAAQSSEQVKGAAVEPGHDRHVDITRAPAASLGEEHDGKPGALCELEQAVLLGVIAHSLRAREHGVVVGHRDDAAAIDLAHPRDEAVGGRARNELLARAPTLLGREDQGAVLHEGALVEEVCEVLPRRASSALASPRHRLGPRCIEAKSVARAHRLKIGSRASRLGCLLSGLGASHPI